MRAASSAATAIRSRPSAPIRNGRAAIEWGVYGVPETFVVGRDGRIAYKLVGPITPDNLDKALKPAIEKALAAPNWRSASSRRSGRDSLARRAIRRSRRLRRGVFRAAADTAARANRKVSGTTPNTLKLTQKSVVCVRQTISLRTASAKKNSAQRTVSLRQPSSVR